MRTIHLCLFVTVLSPAVMGQPLLQHLVDFLGGIKYVPPPSSEAKVHKGEPIFNKEKEEERPKRGSAVAFEAGIEPASSNQVVRDWEQVGEWEYRAGEEDVTQVEATAWCQGQGGKLAQVGEEARKVVARLTSFHHWVQRPEGPSAPVRFSATPRQEDCWILEAGTDRAVARDCDVARQGSFGVRALCQRRRDQECTAPFFLDTAISSEVPWLGRIADVASSAVCHQHCLDTATCLYWSLHLATCFLYSVDGAVEKRQGAVAGGIARGCSVSVQQVEWPKVEHCSCVTPSQASHATSSSGYIDPRALPSTAPEVHHLGRLAARGRPCPWGQDLVCTDDKEKVEVEELPAIIEAKNPPRRSLNITACLVNDVRLKSGGHMRGGVEIVSGPEKCHALCLERRGCRFWTWRGDSSKKCFLRSEQGEVVRRAGAVAGSTLSHLGCDHVLEEQVEAREEQVVEECRCEREEEEDSRDLVGSGLIDPRHLGRIVNRDCAKGWRRVCRGRQDLQETFLFQTGPGYSAVGPRAQEAVEIDPRTLPKRQLDVEESKIAFPEEE